MASGFRIAGARGSGRTWLLRLAALGVLLAVIDQSGITRGFRRRATVVLGHAEVGQSDEQAINVAATVKHGAAAAADEEPAAAELPLAVGAEAVPHPADPALVHRCRGTIGEWCLAYLQQKAIPSKAPPVGNKTCLWGCNFVGVCDHQAGWCRCPAGWIGDDCSTRLRRPCSRMPPLQVLPSVDKPVDPSKPLHPYCAGLCDEDIGYCFCNSSMAYGHQLASPDQPPGTPPVRRGRPLGIHCQPNKDDSGNPLWFGDKEPEEVWGPDGWCNAEQPEELCPCILDGYCGRFCDKPCQAFCPNQCNGHGECNMGFCKCHEGWWGQDCAHRTAGTPWSPGLEASTSPWLQEFVDTPASRDPEPGQTRMRPLIYVYELPPVFNAIMLQYRVDKAACVHRLFTEDNETQYNDAWGYVAETALHEALLQSEHRTLNPGEADFFYLPVYSSCYLYPVHGANDSPFFHAWHGTPRLHAAVNMLVEAHAWVRSHLPYWDRSGGQDHIVLMTHDEGSCWLPAVLRPAIMLTHWGRMDQHHISQTGYVLDNYTINSRHDVWMPEGHIGKLGDFPCYDPAKDLVIPPMTSAYKYRSSQLVGAPARPRHILAFFKGRTQQGNPPYSRGIRQKLENLSRDRDWWGRHRITVGEAVPPEVTGEYSDMLASSTFCLVLPGDGFSPRFEDAMHHGCIPVIIQDNVHLGFESILDLPAFAVRIAQADMERVPDILTAYSAEQIRGMQRNLHAVWRRYAYTGYKQYAGVTRNLTETHRAAAAAAAVQPDGEAAAAGGEAAAAVAAADARSAPEPERDYDVLQDDAMQTIYAWLYSRIPHTRGAASSGSEAPQRHEQQGAAPGGAGDAG